MTTLRTARGSPVPPSTRRRPSALYPGLRRLRAGTRAASKATQTNTFHRADTVNERTASGSAPRPRPDRTYSAATPPPTAITGGTTTTVSMSAAPIRRRRDASFSPAGTVLGTAPSFSHRCSPQRDESDARHHRHRAEQTSRADLLPAANREHGRRHHDAR